MPNINDKLLHKLNDNIEKLVIVVNQYNHIKIDKACFDLLLFRDIPSQTSYQYYLSEISSNYQKLVNLIDKNSDNDHLAQIHYLAELMTNQIEALQRELATISIKIPSDDYKVETLYEKYNRNLNYLYRLETMKYELQQAEKPNNTDISVLNQRIARCKQAITELEVKIETT